MSCCRKTGLPAELSKEPKQGMNRSSNATQTTPGDSREATRKGVHVKSGFLLACELPPTALQAETCPWGL